jgi:gamma-glutamyltranspeptidase/glutathione hydrolase
VQVLTNLLDFGMGLQEAGDAPRWHHGGSSDPTGRRMADGGTVALESGFASDVVRDLARRGHRVVHRGGVFGGYQAIRRDAEQGTEGVWVGATESRKDGCALGW